MVLGGFDAVRLIIDANPNHLGHVHLGPGLVNVVVQEPTEFGVMLPDQFGNGGHRHGLDQRRRHHSAG